MRSGVAERSSGVAEAREWLVRQVLDDGSLGVRMSPELLPLVEAWLPRFASQGAAPAAVRGWIEVRSGPTRFEPPSEPPRFSLGSLSGWFDEGGKVLLSESGQRVSGVLDLEGMQARIRLAVSEAEGAELRLEIFGILSLAAALLLGRMGRTLVHAGAVVDASGAAWLLCGESFSGKTTTCLNLVRLGWDYLSDDNVLLEEADGKVWVEGWPRPFNLDYGYESGASQGVRRRVDPLDYGPGRWRSRAPLGGILFPRVLAALPTTLSRLRVVDALAGLLRQNPWLIGDREAAAPLLKLMTRAAGYPAYGLQLGTDSYRDAAVIQRLLRQVAQERRGNADST
jgi:hypothetical protein